jgi:hypothetical protein
LGGESLESGTATRPSEGIMPEPYQSAVFIASVCLAKITRVKKA